MIALIEQHRSQLDELCRRHHVLRLEAFGSATDGTWDPERSDLDFLVDFLPMPPSDHSRSYFSLWFALQDLFGHDVDLIETPAIHNRHFLHRVNQGRQTLYAA